MSFSHPGAIAHQLASLQQLNVDADDISANAAIEQAVRAMLADSPASNTANLAIAARNGVLTLEGTVTDGLWLARFKNRVTSALPSVTINDRLEWVLPDCGIGFA